MPHRASRKSKSGFLQNQVGEIYSFASFQLLSTSNLYRIFTTVAGAETMSAFFSNGWRQSSGTQDNVKHDRHAASLFLGNLRDLRSCAALRGR